MKNKLAALLIGFIALGAGFSAPAFATEKAIFAGGCFWCVESDFENVPGVIEAVSGYTGGTLDNPTYKKVSKGGTGHYEAVEITFDPNKVSYGELVEIFWRSVDPTDGGGQFCDRGDSYKTAIFAVDATQKSIAKKSKARLKGALSGPIVTPIVDAKEFFVAEKVHQNYYKTHSIRYKYYRNGCGRDKRIRAIWGAQAHRGITKH